MESVQTVGAAFLCARFQFDSSIKCASETNVTILIQNLNLDDGNDAHTQYVDEICKLFLGAW